MKNSYKAYVWVIILTLFVFSVSSCKNDKNDYALSLGTGNEVYEEISTDDISSIKFLFGTEYYILNNGMVLGKGQNSAYNLGLGHNEVVEKYTRIPIPEKIERVIEIGVNSTAFVAASGNVYFTGANILQNTSSYYFTPVKQELSSITGNIIDIKSINNKFYFITKTGKAYSAEADTLVSDLLFKNISEIKFPEKVVAIGSGVKPWFLTENGKLYSEGEFKTAYFEESYKINVDTAIGSNSLMVIAENVKEFNAGEYSATILTTDGKVLWAGMNGEKGPVDTEKHSSVVEKIDNNSYVKTFVEINLPERIVDITSFPNGFGAIGESGRLYALNYWYLTSDDYYNLAPSMTAPLDTKVLIDNIENVEEIEFIDHNYFNSEYKYAIKYSDKGWVFKKP